MLTLILLTWRIWWANNASKWQMGFNSAFRGLMTRTSQFCLWCPYQVWRHCKSSSWRPSSTVLTVLQHNHHPGRYFCVNSTPTCMRISCLIRWDTASCCLDCCLCQPFFFFLVPNFRKILLCLLLWIFFFYTVVSCFSTFFPFRVNREKPTRCN